MAHDIKFILDGKLIMILGFGSEGQSTYKTLRAWFPHVPITIADRDEEILERNPELSNDNNLHIQCGENYIRDCDTYDLIIKSPGIPYDLLAGKCEPLKISSQTDLFLRAYGNRVIGVTGTKGKSTVVTLIHHILKQSGHKTILAGNIGVPPLDFANQIDANTEVVFEMSSHQLEHITVAPQTAVLLNIFPEHLDHYKDFTAYKMAKFNISRLQPEGGILVYHHDDPIVAELVTALSGEEESLAFSLLSCEGMEACLEGENIICFDNSGKKHSFPLDAAADLPGRHNILNMMAAILVCLNKGLGDVDILQGLKTYKRLAHRLEFAGEFRGIKFYDDSIATIPEASIMALETLDKVDLLILGGYDRGLDYTALYNYLKASPVPHLLFMGDAGKRMYDHCSASLVGKSICVFTEGMEGCFDYIRSNLTEDDICLLSPAAASYGMFKNFEERGDVFKKMAAKL